MMLLALIAQAVSPPKVEPGIPVIPPPMIQVSPRPVVLLSALSPQARAKVEALDAELKLAINAAHTRDLALSKEWTSAVTAEPLDPKRVRKAATDLDALADRGPIMTKWVDLLLSFAPADRKILAERLRWGGGRVFDFVPAPPPPVSAEARASRERRDFAHATLLKVERDALSRDPSRGRRADQRVELLKRSAAAMAATPFDAKAVKKAFADLSRSHEEDAAIRRGHMIDALAALSPEEREALLTEMPNMVGKIAYTGK